MMTEAEYAEMSEAMNATVGEFPAETEGVGNQVLEPVVAGRRDQGVRADGGRDPVGGRTRQGRRRLDLQRDGARPEDPRRGGRPGRDRAPQRAADGHRRARPRRQPAQQHGRGRPGHPGPRASPARPSPTTSRPTRWPWPCTTPTTTARCRCPTVCSAPCSSATCPCPPGGRSAATPSRADLQVAPGDPHGAQRQPGSSGTRSTARASRPPRRSPRRRATGS